jgi:hypothetical protein
LAVQSKRLPVMRVCNSREHIRVELADQSARYDLKLAERLLHDKQDSGEYASALEALDKTNPAAMAYRKACNGSQSVTCGSDRHTNAVLEFRSANKKFSEASSAVTREFPNGPKDLKDVERILGMTNRIVSAAKAVQESRWPALEYQKACEFQP